MAKNDSVQKRLGKVRPPRVQMTYDVEIGDAVDSKELPFVLGVVGDFGSDPNSPKKRLKERGFVNIDNGNFDEVLAGVAPTANFLVANRLGGDGEFPVQLRFSSMADFRPEAVASQVAPLNKLLQARSKLADLRNKLAGNEQLEDLLAEVLGNTDQLAALSAQTEEGED
ncbi:type VI secretion system contractile sheath small subunit [Massilia sp. erpn]|uniref:type VI secretion system contractile sheath small subunit n=1 Tax=Massilia sp. erpn TaxID=2738142 RepID=UPI0021050849|nr:type VI secretion system contractile sheath small subunit [Massilia sp. erpn]UTY58617.1 type VI secretion system contractile sheath small subunit [Massilia sp. erpn]